MPQKECINSRIIIFTLQHKHYLWIARTEKQSSHASVNSGELPFQNSYCRTNTFPAGVIPVSFFAQSPQIEGMLRQGLVCWSSKLLAFVIPDYIK